jgi:hypothetical protein
MAEDDMSDGDRTIRFENQTRGQNRSDHERKAMDKGGLMGDKTDRELLRMSGAILKASAAGGAAFDFRLKALEMAWITLAEEARSAALLFPGGFPAERQRQLEHLEKMAALVRGGEPDQELERLYEAGDVDGVLERLRRLRDSVGGGIQDDENKKAD